jgi:hypothetical protein
MALPDYFVQSQGTAIVWGESGATGVTKTLSLNALADASARMGASQDLGADWDKEYIAIIVVETGTAPTAGNTVDVYLACSHNGTDWPGGVTGSDAAYTLGTSDQNLRQLGQPITSLIATNNGNTVQRQNAVIIRPTARYVAPVIDNNLGQAIRNETTATDNDSRLILIPLDEKVID